MRASRYARAVGAVAALERALHVAEAAVRHRVADEGADRHTGQLLFDQAEFGDRLAELPPLPGISDGMAERLLDARHVARAQLDAAEVQDVERHLVPLA